MTSYADRDDVHGGGVMCHEGVYYWYGEHKIEGSAGNVAHVGVHCYSSTELCNWQDEGVALEVSDDPDHEITKGCILERPKVIHNGKPPIGLEGNQPRVCLR